MYLLVGLFKYLFSAFKYIVFHLGIDLYNNTKHSCLHVEDIIIHFQMLSLCFFCFVLFLTKRSIVGKIQYSKR